MIDMAFVARDFVNSDVEQIIQLSIFQLIFNNILNGLAYCISMEIKEQGNDLSGNYYPISQNETQKKLGGLLPSVQRITSTLTSRLAQLTLRGE